MDKILFYNKFIICPYIFRALCAHRQEGKIVLYSFWYQQTYRWPSGAQIERVLSHHDIEPLCRDAFIHGHYFATCWIKASDVLRILYNRSYTKRINVSMY